MVKLELRWRKRRAYIRLFVALGVGFWAAMTVFGPREVQEPRGSCAFYLRVWMQKEQRFFGDHARYTTRVREVDLSAGDWNDLLLVADPNGTIERKPEQRSRLSLDTILASSERAANAPPSVLPAVAAGGERIGITGQCPSCSITLACVENLDEDSDFSVWTVSSHDRVTDRGEMIRAAVPYLEHSDDVPLEGAPAYAELIR